MVPYLTRISVFFSLSKRNSERISEDAHQGCLENHEIRVPCLLLGKAHTWWHPHDNNLAYVPKAYVRTPHIQIVKAWQCMYCNSYVRQYLRMQSSLNFEFGTYIVIKCIFMFFNLNKVTQHFNYTCLLFWKCSLAYY